MNEDVVFTVATFLFLVVLLFALRKLLQVRKRRMELDLRIDAARKTREMKHHYVLDRDDGDADCPYFTAAQTREYIVSKKLDPQQNITNLSKRCRLYGRSKNVNAITEEFYQEAFETAGSLEQFKSLDQAPALYGIPVSVKDCVSMKGGTTTGGMACRLNKKDKDDCVTMELCRRAGAIPLCRGNVVQIMMSSECYNRIWGRTTNPWDLKRTPGGSSGGDAALVAMGCVPMSIAADGGGSIRIPSSYCGIVGFKPTTNRFSYLRCMKPRKNNTYGAGVAISAVQGPITRSVEDCAMYMRAVCVPELWKQDLNVPPVPWNEREYRDTSRRLKIGYFDTDGWFEPCVTSKRAIKEVIEALQKAGHTCVPFKPPTDGSLHLRLFVGILLSEGKARSFFDALEGEPMISEYNTFVLGQFLAKYVHRFVSLFDKRLGACLEAGRERSVYELWELTGKMLNMRTAWSEAMRTQEIDALIFPSMPTPAPLEGMSAKIPSSSYIFLAPLLMWPTGVVPVTVVREDEQHYRKDDLPKSQRDIIATFTAQIMNGSAGMPIGVSVMTSTFKDEQCLRLMKEIEQLVQFECRPTEYKNMTKNNEKVIELSY